MDEAAARTPARSLRRSGRRSAGDLVGLYLHGSAALGDYHPDRSDVDLLAVCVAPLGDTARDTVAARLAADALPCPAAGGLEFSLITRSERDQSSDRPGV